MLCKKIIVCLELEANFNGNLKLYFCANMLLLGIIEVESTGWWNWDVGLSKRKPYLCMCWAFMIGEQLRITQLYNVERMRANGNRSQKNMSKSWEAMFVFFPWEQKGVEGSRIGYLTLE